MSHYAANTEHGNRIQERMQGVHWRAEESLCQGIVEWLEPVLSSAASPGSEGVLCVPRQE